MARIVYPSPTRLVMDLDDPEQIERLVSELRKRGVGTLLHPLRNAPVDVDPLVYAVTGALFDFARPRPDEPGLWGVVEASCVHNDQRRTFVRGQRGWNAVDTAGEPDPWDDLIGPVVKRPGLGDDALPGAGVYEPALGFCPSCGEKHEG